MEKAQVLIVEDDGIVAMDIESRLKNLGYSVSGTVIYAEKAIEKVEELKPDLVLMDIVLKGGMDGIEAAEIIRSRFDIPVVFLTAYADEERFGRAKLTIPFGYILKPFQDRDLKITIEMALYTAKVDAERKQAEERLLQESTMRGVLLDNLPCVALILKKETREIAASNKAAKQIGAVPGKTCYQTCAQRDDTCSFCLAPKLWATGDPQRLEVEYEGTYYEGIWVPLTEELYVHYIFDITDRKKAEEALRESEEKFRNLFNNAEVGMFRTRIDGSEILDMNEKFLEIFCRTREEMKDSPSVIHWADPSQREEMVHRLELEGRVTNFECGMLNKHGEVRTCLTSLRLYRDQDILEGSIIDITDRKRAEEALRESEQRYRRLTENAKDLIWRTDTKGKILFVNSTVETLLGYSQKDAINLHLKEYMTKESEKLLSDEINRSLSDKSHSDHFRIEVEYISKNNKIIPFEINASILFDTNGEVIGYEGISRDITERKIAQEENKNLERQLQQAQKMESIGTLAGGIAHDFNNILFPIIGYAEMVLEDTSEGSSLRNSINEILHGAKRAGDLVKQILTFSRQADQELKPLQVHFVIKEVLKLMRSSLPSTIKIKQSLKKACGFVIADPTRIHQVAMNLMTNAYHAMEETGGEMEVTLKEVELGVDDLKDQSMTPGAYVCLTVADTGPGMDQAVISRIFEPYFTTKENGKGTGLGLAVVHGIVKSYKGDIKVYSEPGEGTAFHVYLPVIKSQVETDEAEAVTPVQKGTERILLVDDEDSIVRMEKQMLERLGYHVTERTSSIEALEAFRAAPDKFDLVITDMTMPNMTGVQLSQKLLEIRSDIPIIICTGFSTKIDDAKATAAGIRGYVMKPIIMREIAKKIREVLEKD